MLKDVAAYLRMPRHSYRQCALTCRDAEGSPVVPPRIKMKPQIINNGLLNLTFHERIFVTSLSLHTCIEPCSNNYFINSFLTITAKTQQKQM